jgi:hypothetical protein
MERMKKRKERKRKSPLLCPMPAQPAASASAASRIIQPSASARSRVDLTPLSRRSLAMRVRSEEVIHPQSHVVAFVLILISCQVVFRASHHVSFGSRTKLAQMPPIFV